MAPRARLASYQELASWLAVHALPDEIVAVQQRRSWARLTDQPLVVLPEGGDAFTLLGSLQELRPDYCVASSSVAWEGVQASPWFQEHYRPAVAATTVGDPASPLILFRYERSPFEAGDTLLLEQTLQGQEVGSMTVQSVRLSSNRLVTGVNVYATVTLSGDLREPLTALWRLREVASGRIWAQERRTQPGGMPTDAWSPNTLLAERYVVVPPPELPPGEYVLELGFARPNRAPFGEPLLVGSLHSPPDVSALPPVPDHPLEIMSGEAITLLGYDAPAQLSPGSSLRIAFYWHARRPIEEELKVFVHVFGPTEAPALVTQSDAIPVHWTYPTTEWQEGDYVRDVHALPIDLDLPRGNYRVVVGLYDSVTGERLELRDADGNALPDNVAPLYDLRIR